VTVSRAQLIEELLPGLNALFGLKEETMTEQLELPFEPPLDKLRGLTRAYILRTAEDYVTVDRAAEHGDMEDNFTTIASYWSIHLGTDVTATDVAAMMALLKIARVRGNEQNLDNWIDGCGYMACGGELADVDE
jgi:HAMP domain-containing protein